MIQLTIDVILKIEKKSAWLVLTQRSYVEAVAGQVEKVNSRKWTLRQKLVGIIINPHQTFGYLAKNPDWITPLLAIIFATSIATIMLSPKILSLLSNVPDKIRIFTLATSLIIGMIISVATFLIVALFFFITGTLLMGYATFKEAIALFGYAWLPTMLKGLLVSIYSTADKVNLSPGLTGLFSRNINNYFKALLSNLDIFNIWSLVLFIFAFSALFGFSRKKSVITIVTIWIFSIIVVGATNFFASIQ